jgi:hypothetical protein
MQYYSFDHLWPRYSQFVQICEILKSSTLRRIAGVNSVLAFLKSRQTAKIPSIGTKMTLSIHIRAVLNYTEGVYL